MPHTVCRMGRLVCHFVASYQGWPHAQVFRGYGGGGFEVPPCPKGMKLATVQPAFALAGYYHHSVALQVSDMQGNVWIVPHVLPMRRSFAAFIWLQQLACS